MGKRRIKRGVQQFNVAPRNNVNKDYSVIPDDEIRMDVKDLHDEWDELNELDWNTVVERKYRPHNSASFDVSVNIYQSRNTEKLSVIFRMDDFVKTYARERLLIVLSRNKKRMYFYPHKNGFTCTHYDGQRNAYLRIPIDEKYRTFVGDYDLKWEPAERLYFIELDS